MGTEHAPQFSLSLPDLFRIGGNSQIYGATLTVRDDSARCLMLFQQLFRGSPIRRVLHETPLASPPQREQFVDLALRLGRHLI